VRLGDNHLGTEHVLLGILRNEDGTAVRMLAGMGVSTDVLEELLYELRGRPDRVVGRRTEEGSAP
jgi:ATP-dependent Clp protease ATP-binding subunit ClpC